MYEPAFFVLVVTLLGTQALLLLAVWYGFRAIKSNTDTIRLHNDSFAEVGCFLDAQAEVMVAMGKPPSGVPLLVKLTPEQTKKLRKSMGEPDAR